jgi:RNA polymerase sigma-70 factor, ECF subfamily
MVAVDADLTPFVLEAQAGEPAAWDRLLRRYQLPLYSYAYELVRDEQASLDIVQETFINAVRRVASLREAGKFGSWLFGICHQKCLQHWRRHGREARLREEELPADWPDPASDPGELLIHREAEAQFLRALEQLPAPQRAVVLLHFVEDFSIDEIAAVTGVPAGTVKSRLHYAKCALRALLEERT